MRHPGAAFALGGNSPSLLISVEISAHYAGAHARAGDVIASSLDVRTPYNVRREPLGSGGLTNLHADDRYARERGDQRTLGELAGGGVRWPRWPSADGAKEVAGGRAMRPRRFRDRGQPK